MYLDRGTGVLFLVMGKVSFQQYFLLTLGTQVLPLKINGVAPTLKVRLIHKHMHSVKRLLTSLARYLSMFLSQGLIIELAHSLGMRFK